MRHSDVRVKLRKRAFLAGGVLCCLVACTSNRHEKSYILAERLWEAGNYAEAAAEFERVASAESASKLGDQALYRAAMTRTVFLNDHLGALENFKKYIQRNPQSELTWSAQVEIGEILFTRLKRYDQAIAHYEAMIEKIPEASKADAPMYFLRIAQAEAARQQYEEARRRYRELANLFPETEWGERALFEVGNLYFTRGAAQPGSAQKAIDVWTEFLKRFPQSRLAVDAEFGIANCLEELERWDEALAKFQSLESRYPSPNVVKIKIHRVQERLSRKSGPAGADGRR